MKNKIYSKLFEFCDIKTWTKDGDKFKSEFYSEFKLEMINSDMYWLYKVYAGSPPSLYSSGKSYNVSPSHTGVITLSSKGKWWFSALVSILLAILHFIFLSLSWWMFGYIGLSILISYFLCSIFNWRMYLTLRRVQKYQNDSLQRKQQEEDEKLENDVINIVNQTLSKNPKLLRKNKLKQLKK